MSRRRIVDANLAPGRIVGRAHWFWSEKYNRWIVRSWPRPRTGNSQKQQKAIDDFRAVTRLIKQATPLEVIAAYDQAKQKGFLPRDLLASAAYGRLVEADMADGTQLLSLRRVQLDAQQLLASIGNANGMILLNSDGEWVALLPGSADDVLTMDGPTGCPQWKPAAGGGPSAQPESAFVVLTGNKTHTLVGGYQIPWDNDLYDSDTFWDVSAPTKLVIPAGINFANVSTSVRIDSDSGSTTQVLIQHYNSANVLQRQFSNQQESTTVTSKFFNVTALGVPVSTGDYFIIVASGTDTSATLNASSGQCSATIQGFA